MVLKNVYAHLLRGRKTLTKYGEWAGEWRTCIRGSLYAVRKPTTFQRPQHTVPFRHR